MLAFSIQRKQNKEQHDEIFHDCCSGCCRARPFLRRGHRAGSRFRQRPECIEEPSSRAKPEQPWRPEAGNPGSAAQVPTAPQKQEDLYDSGASGAASGEAGSEDMSKPQTSDPAQQ